MYQSFYPTVYPTYPTVITTAHTCCGCSKYPQALIDYLVDRVRDLEAEVADLDSQLAQALSELEEDA